MDEVFFGPRQDMHLGALGGQQARLVRIGEERDRRLGADQDDVLEARQHLERLIDRIGDAFDRHTAAAALHAAR